MGECWVWGYLTLTQFHLAANKTCTWSKQTYPSGSQQGIKSNFVYWVTIYTTVQHTRYSPRVTGHLSDNLYEILRTFVRHGHFSDNLTSNLYVKQFHMLKGLYQVIIDKHKQGIEANCKLRATPLHQRCGWQAHSPGGLRKAGRVPRSQLLITGSCIGL